MGDLDILDIARAWSFWDGDVPASVPREVDLPGELRDSLCLVIQGVRRCGKSTLLQQLLGRYDLDSSHCAFVNFEDPRLAGSLTYETLERLVERFRARHEGVERLYFLLDEIQWVDGWQRWIRTHLDRPQGNVFVVTGSNAKLLGDEVSSVLTGRHLTVELYPFGLSEVRKVDAATSLGTYLTSGGFPAPLSMSDGDRLLRQYFDDIIERDVRERVGSRSSLVIRQLVQMAFETAGSEMSLRRIAGALGIAVETAANYLEAAEAAYLLFSCPYFAFSERKRASRNRKYYPVDTGLRRCVVTRTGSDQGKMLECATHLALRKRFGRVFYFRERGEVDFVVQEGTRILPVQVSWDGPAERHQRALDEFYERFPQAEEAVFVTADDFEDALARATTLGAW